MCARCALAAKLTHPRYHLETCRHDCHNKEAERIIEAYHARPDRRPEPFVKSLYW